MVLSSYQYMRRSDNSLHVPWMSVFLLPWLTLGMAIAGNRYLGVGGLLGCLAVSNLLVCWVFGFRERHGLKCESCGRPVLNRRRGSEVAERLGLPGIFMRTSDFAAGRVSPGSQCLHCHRIYCGCSHPQEVCACGSSSLRTILVEYPGFSL
jgi:hypothetical protein